jgi:hypothetical protein
LDSSLTSRREQRRAGGETTAGSLLTAKETPEDALRGELPEFDNMSRAEAIAIAGEGEKFGLQEREERRGRSVGEEGLVELEVVEVLDVLGSLVSKTAPFQNCSAQLVHSGGLKSLAVRAKMPPQFPFERRQKPLNLNLERITMPWFQNHSPHPYLDFPLLEGEKSFSWTSKSLSCGWLLEQKEVANLLQNYCKAVAV